MIRPVGPLPNSWVQSHSTKQVLAQRAGQSLMPQVDEVERERQLRAQYYDLQRGLSGSIIALRYRRRRRPPG